jgi:hypothetical protein
LIPVPLKVTPQPLFLIVSGIIDPSQMCLIII